MRYSCLRRLGPIGTMLLCQVAGYALAEEPPVISPFGRAPTEREDSTPGYIELSDGTVVPGMLYLTRDHRLTLLDSEIGRQRLVPLRVVKQIECNVQKEWMEREWRFKELASDEKYYTGRSYPTREYEHAVTLHDGRVITGPLSAVLYVEPIGYTPERPGAYRTVAKAEKYILHKRDKGKIGDALKDMVYVKRVLLGQDAFEEGKKKAAGIEAN
ncbi:MAG: hypothetical protein U1E05_17380 [Patescibacteria group bacterium]|nr:hypothetical protein [Patescibacteria group bacterium]